MKFGLLGLTSADSDMKCHAQSMKFNLKYSTNGIYGHCGSSIGLTHNNDL